MVDKSGETVKVKLHQDYFHAHRCEIPSLDMEVSKTQLVDMYREMVTMRRMEMAADQVSLPRPPNTLEGNPSAPSLSRARSTPFACTDPDLSIFVHSYPSFRLGNVVVQQLYKAVSALSPLSIWRFPGTFYPLETDLLPLHTTYIHTISLNDHLVKTFYRN